MKPGKVRIIGGQWRGRLINVPEGEGLRPTPDRVRETLFNWLAQIIPGARCLDAFAGTGVLGFEALSRGASYVEMVDKDKNVIAALQKTAISLATEAVAIYQAQAPFGLKRVQQPFDVVFLDPPYQADLVIPSIQYLEENAFLAPRAWIYLEANVKMTQVDLPANWHLQKEKRAGQVYYHLVLRESV